MNQGTQEKKMSPIIKYGGGFVAFCILLIVIAFLAGFETETGKAIRDQKEKEAQRMELLNAIRSHDRGTYVADNKRTGVIKKIIHIVTREEYVKNIVKVYVDVNTWRFLNGDDKLNFSQMLSAIHHKKGDTPEVEVYDYKTEKMFLHWGPWSGLKKR